MVPNIIHRMVLRQLPGPLLGWLGVLLFLLLMQFLIKFLPELTGRDLPFAIVLELIAYNLAYMVVLSAPMAALLTSLMVFGSLAESRTWVVIRNCGITLWGLTWPVFAAAILLTWGMVYFNNVLLPESNFRARNMWEMIRTARPGFSLEPGVFYQEIDDYSILVGERNGNLLQDILIYDYTQGGVNGATIRADRGELVPLGNVVNLILNEGEMHRLTRRSDALGTERYEKLAFERLQLRLDLSELGFQVRDPSTGYRSDRSTPMDRMLSIVDSLEIRLSEQEAELRSSMPEPPSEKEPDVVSTDVSPSSSLEWLRTESFTASDFGDNPTQQTIAPRPILDGLTEDQMKRTFQRARDYSRDARSSIGGKGRNLERTASAINRYKVEIHKKYSISVACFIFVLIGIPLGLSIRRGGLGTAGMVAVGIFLFYWVTLVQGEKLADRGLLSPWIGMWCANIVIGIVGIWLFIRVALDMRARPRSTLKFLSRRLPAKTAKNAMDGIYASDSRPSEA